MEQIDTTIRPIAKAKNLRTPERAESLQELHARAAAEILQEARNQLQALESKAVEVAQPRKRKSSGTRNRRSEAQIIASFGNDPVREASYALERVHKMEAKIRRVFAKLSPKAKDTIAQYHPQYKHMCQ